MPVNVSVKTVNNLPFYGAKTIKQADLALGRMAKDIETVAKSRVPLRTGALMSSGRFAKVGYFGNYDITFNTPYARRWEFERANFRNGRQSQYLRSSVRTVAGKIDVYFRSAITG